MSKPMTVCFSGYQPEKFALIMNKGESAYLELENRIEKAILESVDAGYNTFICGMAKGFDLVAGSIVVSLKESWAELKNIHLMVVLAFEGHGFHGDPWHILHEMVLGRATQIVTLSPHCHAKAYHDRDCFIVDHSSRLIYYNSGGKGRNNTIVKYAQKQGLEIINLYQ